MHKSSRRSSLASIFRIGQKSKTWKLRGKVAKADRLEANTTDDLVWVVAMNADQGLTPVMTLFSSLTLGLF
jgi:hypothetical protein